MAIGLRENTTVSVLSHGLMEVNTKVNGGIVEKTGKASLLGKMGRSMKESGWKENTMDGASYRPLMVKYFLETSRTVKSSADSRTNLAANYLQN